MSLRQIKVHGRKVWQARVAFKGLRKSTIRPSKQEARDAEADPLRDLKEQAGQVEREGQAPATLRQLLAFYAEDMADRGKGEESVERVDYTRQVIEDLMPELLDKPVSLIGDAEIFAFRNARAREGKVVVELVGGVKAKRRVPAKALPGQATMALNRGFTAPIVMALGGWKTGRMMRRYAAVTDETPRNAAEAGRDRGFESRRGHHSTTSYCLEGLTGEAAGPCTTSRPAGPLRSSGQAP